MNQYIDMILRVVSAETKIISRGEETITVKWYHVHNFCQNYTTDVMNNTLKL